MSSQTVLVAVILLTSVFVDLKSFSSMNGMCQCLEQLGRNTVDKDTATTMKSKTVAARPFKKTSNGTTLSKINRPTIEHGRLARINTISARQETVGTTKPLVINATRSSTNAIADVTRFIKRDKIINVTETVIVASKSSQSYDATSSKTNAITDASWFTKSNDKNLNDFTEGILDNSEKEINGIPSEAVPDSRKRLKCYKIHRPGEFEPYEYEFKGCFDEEDVRKCPFNKRCTNEALFKIQPKSFICCCRETFEETCNPDIIPVTRQEEFDNGEDMPEWLVNHLSQPHTQPVSPTTTPPLKEKTESHSKCGWRTWREILVVCLLMFAAFVSCEFIRWKLAKPANINISVVGSDAKKESEDDFPNVEKPEEKTKGQPSEEKSNEYDALKIEETDL